MSAPTVTSLLPSLGASGAPSFASPPSSGEAILQGTTQQVELREDLEALCRVLVGVGTSNT